MNQQKPETREQFGLHSLHIFTAGDKLFSLSLAASYVEMSRMRYLRVATTGFHVRKWSYKER
jgi:hypothetical protein